MQQKFQAEDTVFIITLESRHKISGTALRNRQSGVLKG